MVNKSNMFLFSWINLINSNGEALFEEAWGHLVLQYEEYELILNYIRGTLLSFEKAFC